MDCNDRDRVDQSLKCLDQVPAGLLKRIGGAYDQQTRISQESDDFTETPNGFLRFRVLQVGVKTALKVFR